MKQFVDFKEEHLYYAAELLAKRHRNERKMRRELPKQFEDKNYALKALQDIWDKPHACGVAAYDHERFVGYIIGNCAVDTGRGRTAWIHYAGLAIDEDQQPELYRDLYAHIADRWLAFGCFDHYAVVPAGDHSTVGAWLRLGFSYQQVYAIYDLNQFVPFEKENNTGIKIRMGKREDRVALSENGVWNTLHQASAPAWNPVLPEVLEDVRKSYAGLVDDEEAILRIVEKGDEIIGFHVCFPDSFSDTNMLIPDKCVELSAAAIKPSERGAGIGKQLAQNSFQYFKELGYTHCSIDWHMTNLLASRFWPKQGFQPTAYRLVRRIDSRIAWANGV